MALQIAHFASVAECLADANTPVFANDVNRARWHDLKDRKKDDWYGLREPTNAAGIESLINGGWTEGAGKIQRQADAVEVARLPSVRRRRIRGDRGDTLDMDRVYMGALDTAWTRTAKAASSNPPRVHVVVNLSAHAGIQGDQLFWRGAAVLALAARLVEAGYAVQLSSAFHARGYDDNGRHNFLATVVVKDFRAPLEINSMAATTALAGFMRSILFLQMQKHCPAETGYGLGKPQPVALSDIPDCGAHHTFIAHELWDASQARAWIRSVLEKLNPSAQAA